MLGWRREILGREDRRSPEAQAFLDAEERDGITGVDHYLGFADRVERMRDDLRTTLERYRDEGRRVAEYGAAAKGTVMLNVCDLGTDLVEFVVDRNVHKHGHLMPGTHQPIRPVEALVEDQPDDVLILAWNFTDEIVAQQQAYLDAGGRFLRPVPRVEVVQ